MEDNLGSVFMTNEHIKQIEKIVNFRNELKLKYPDIFKDESMYMAIDVNGLPKYENGKSIVSLNLLYNDNIPEHIKE